MLQPQPPGPGPAGTARVARAAFPKGAPLLTLRAELGAVFSDDDFAVLYRGFDFSVLSEFRGRLVDGGAEHVLLDRVPAACRDRGL